MIRVKRLSNEVKPSRSMFAVVLHFRKNDVTMRFVRQPGPLDDRLCLPYRDDAPL
jgi:hypothetical protein